VGVRNIRGEMNIPPGKALTILLRNGNTEDKRRIGENAPFLTKLAKLEEITWLEPDEQAPMAATSLVGDLELLVPMAGLIDKDAELARLAREIDKLEKELQRIAGKLDNPSFVDRAPAAVVEKEREKMHGQRDALHKLKEQEQQLQQL
jgi:valyl-tRNA synthetase